MVKTKKLSPAIIERRRRVAYHLKRLRLERGIERQVDLAEKMNIDPSYIRRLESGHAPFGSDMEQRFAHFYRVDFSEFYRPIPISNADKEMAELQKKIQALGGSEKIRQLSRITDALIGGQRNGEDTSVPPGDQERKEA